MRTRHVSHHVVMNLSEMLFLFNCPPPCHPPSFSPLFPFPFCWGPLSIGRDFLTKNHCLSVSTLLPLSWPYSSRTRARRGLHKLLSILKHFSFFSAHVTCSIQTEDESNRHRNTAKFLSSSSHKQNSLCLWVVGQADASEAFCRIQSAPFFLLSLRGAEKFPKHIPLWDRHKEQHLSKERRILSFIHGEISHLFDCNQKNIPVDSDPMCQWINHKWKTKEAEFFQKF